jgi:predicted Zn-dependent peptidase
MSCSRMCLVIALLGACAPTRAPLTPAAPPPRAPAELSVWQTPPQRAPERDLSLPMRIERVVLPNGLGVTVVTRPEAGTTALELWVPSARDRSEGQVAVMAEALRAGTHTRKEALLVNPKLAFEPVFVNTSAAGTTFAWQALPRASEQAIQLLADFVFDPVFEPVETQIRLQEQLTFILRNAGGPAHLANLARAELPGLAIPGPEHDARGVFKLSPELLRHVHRCTVLPAGAELAVVGPRSFEEVLPWARAAFGGRSAAPPDPSCEAFVMAPHDPEKSRLDRIELGVIYGGTFDPLMVMAVAGPGPRSPDYVPFALLAEVLTDRDAGSAQELRHMGATYGIHTSLNHSFPGITLLEVTGQVEPQHAQAALRKLVQDMRGLSQTITEQQLDEVKRRWRNEYINTLSNNRAVAGAALWQLTRGRSPEALKDWPNELMQISIERCREVGRHWLADAQPSVVVAGLPVQLVRGLDLGVRVRELVWTDKLEEQKQAF